MSFLSLIWKLLFHHGGLKVTQLVRYRGLSKEIRDCFDTLLPAKIYEELQTNAYFLSLKQPKIMDRVGPLLSTREYVRDDHNGRYMLYYFSGHRWEYGGNSSAYERKIISHYSKLEALLLKLIHAKYREEEMWTYIKHIRETINKLKVYNVWFKLLKAHCTVKGFGDLLDKNPDLFGCNNGVIELNCELNRKKFRAGDPEDLVTFTCGYDFLPDPLMEKVEQMRTYLHTLLPYAQGYQAFLEFFSESLSGPRLARPTVLVCRGSVKANYIIFDTIASLFGNYGTFGPEIDWQTLESLHGGRSRIVGSLMYSNSVVPDPFRKKFIFGLNRYEHYSFNIVFYGEYPVEKMKDGMTVVDFRPEIVPLPSIPRSEQKQLLLWLLVTKNY